MSVVPDKWYLQQGMRVPSHAEPQPRRETAQEFFTNVLELGRFARERYMRECKEGLRPFEQSVINELDENIAFIEAELAKYK